MSDIEKEENKDSSPPTTPPTGGPTKNNDIDDDEKENKIERSLTENLNKRFYNNNNNNSNNSNGEEIEDIDYKNFKTIKEFGYYYNDKGELRSIEGEEKFKFINQQQYDRLGDIIVKTIQNKMKSEPINLEEHWIPKGETNQCNIFTSKDFFENPTKLMVFINGSGAVKSGQWARSLCINDTLNTGSILPYLNDAISNDFSIIVLNPNYNVFEERIIEEGEEQKEKAKEEEEKKDDNGKLLKKKRVDNSIKGSENSNNHILTVYDEFIKKSPAKEIVIVAHSFGGVNTTYLLDNRGEEIADRLKSIAFTDSVHSLSPKSSSFTKSFFADENKTKNWVKSDKKLNTDLGFSKLQGCNIASSGHRVHEFTSSACRVPLFQFILNSLKK
ncbi:esterase/lipase/thioesterase domain-containing protein [Dictyostelium discoideum AX4]|uniref:Cotranscriptional regulator ARB2A homolog n=1 Tax=Dictyostelium discoideum TaxID=44689 RepID=ARB2A_DICDI|nr:esterase/lipase/thioesterase domain-containing protein [Dictyostelium discoideum AX4]XP_644797.1 esterase/lipase/thioesterase domain-containing protein [Dictyostelium discoideum AX4]Q557B6.1 RecName: Full=Cotranscriptional regulator ARB2A homolog; AltName: Full=FAM172 family protein homolog [Dictyostelium discoideum]EAL70527.1 esterase/lipase/thioesterase domain-containing protein [Dictyostelium discoideum AX4]EAL70836.1 esterase/lipase/thioesterase domain-containing protein [Dictyostelium d|eukprot:XP_644453.1 esterase/lipase/thioesterase domain-containing protein [Dictyostelium discoideum AX4]